jgi:DUF1680 family protein
MKFALHIRIPGWVNKTAAPGGLYKMEGDSAVISYSVNGNAETYRTDQSGYAIIDRIWNTGDVVTFEYKMPVERITSRDELKQNTDRVALQRGPIVYCVEGADNDGKAWNIIFPGKTQVTAIPYKVADEPVIALEANVPVVTAGADAASLQTEIKKIIAIPYYTWCNRGSNQMQVWLPVRINDVKLNY